MLNEKDLKRTNIEEKREENKATVKREDEKYRIYRQMINTFYGEEQSEQRIKISSKGDIKIEPKILYNYNSKELKVEFKIGNKQMYKIKNITEFYERMQKKEKYRYGLKLEFIHTEEAFEKESLPILKFIMKYGEIIKYANESTDKYYVNLLNNSYIVLSSSGMDDFFEAVKGKNIEFENQYGVTKTLFIDEEPNIKFEIIETDEDEFSIITDNDIFDYSIIKGKEYAYFYQKKKIYKCSLKFEKTVLKMLNIFKVNFTKIIPLKKEEFSDFYSLIYPEMKERVITDNVDEKVLNKYLPRKLNVKVFLDYNKSNFITADIRFEYEDIELNPFTEIERKIPRNAIEESKALDLFKNAGFMFDSSRKGLILVSEENIYNFIRNGINELLEKFEVLVTEKFKSKAIIHPKISSAGIKIENNLLTLDLKGFDFESDELEEIMKKYILKKKFHKLKNGQFVDLQDNEALETIAKISEGTNISFKELTKNEIKLPIYRSLYLEKILKKNNIKIKESEEYKNLIKDVQNKNEDTDYLIPENINLAMREYQQTGFKWLKTLDGYGLGGILADDMGLGKTLQVLALIQDYNNKTIDNKLPSLVICPSSLSLNWKEEAEKVAPKLKTIVISGNLEERKIKIKNIKKCDIAITSYDLLKRDLEIYKQIDYNFRYIIADEAQYIKNNNTKNAKAIKEIKAETRFALTGTPIENSLAELWSIFDFIMPGYLFSYNKFKTQYETPIIKEEDMDTLNSLKLMIEPFVLRRVKETVLTELPEKTVSVLNNEMDEEQMKIYASYVKLARKQAKEEIETNGVANSQIKILALLMRLRQICCHPGLFLDNYSGQSSKLNQCIEIIKDAAESGHKMLLFSGYASMFPYIESELDKLGIKYFKLTGQTKVDERMNLVNRFNSEDDIKVFLISLKAGGTGLNLIGADMVIHYDPWWNISAENQATDRTYRIGQKRNVQVYKLITKNSIEEKIYNLQEKKAKLANDMLSTNETFISKLSKDEIMNLFE